MTAIEHGKTVAAANPSQLVTAVAASMAADYQVAMAGLHPATGCYGGGDFSVAMTAIIGNPYRAQCRGDLFVCYGGYPENCNGATGAATPQSSTAGQCDKRNYVYMCVQQLWRQYGAGSGG